MDSASGHTENRQRLDALMNERRRELRIKMWNQVAERAGMTPENLRKIRRGEIRISENAADGIEDALEWERGSVEAIVKDGGEPTPRKQAPVKQVRWTPERERLFLDIEATFARHGLELNEENWRLVEQRYKDRARRATPTGDNST